MIAIQANVEGANEVRQAIVRLQQRISHGLHDAVYEGAQVAREWVEQQMHDTKGGIHWSNLPYRSSAPGEVPASQFGALQESLDVEYGSRKSDRATAVFSAGSARAPYAAELEFGSYKVLPRPFMRPSVDNNKKEILDAEIKEMIDFINRFV